MGVAIAAGIGALTAHVTGALVLAAGASRRMGRQKLAMDVGGKPMVAHAVDCARAAGLPLLLVTGSDAGLVRDAAGDAPQVHAARHALGMAESLKAGVRAAPAGWDALLVLLGDMPGVRPDTLSALAAALARGADAVAPVHAGQRGNPAGFARRLWPELLRLEGDRGARGLLAALPVTQVAVDDPGVLLDYDKPADFG